MQRPIDPRNIEVVDDRVAAILRMKTPAERIEMVGECNRTVRSVIAGRLMTDHPDWSEDQIQQEVARRMFGGPKETWDTIIAEVDAKRRRAE